ncbi:ubiquitin family protein [Xanthobacter aminoxidans]|uniref:hypothetical protein n=1 Tax=Xanthobacter aminoxidans TaxID=186280 RepID=UPI002022C1DF|nr:hypothetical protein [Xanthobacter aminoxidans]MCL8384673.1 hypothetical protein [Xanthobacter aminoxidans]
MTTSSPPVVRRGMAVIGHNIHASLPSWTISAVLPPALVLIIPDNLSSFFALSGGAA